MNLASRETSRAIGAFTAGDNESFINTSIIKLLDSQGREFDPSSKGSTALVMSGDQSAELFMAQIQPGMQKQFSLVYDAPENAKGLKLKIPGGFLSKTGDAVIKTP